MYINNGFTFLNLKGTYSNVDPQTQKPSSHIHTIYEYGLIPVYSSLISQNISIVIEFASINVDNTNEIIDFCNKYGLLYHEKSLNNNTNDYMYFNRCKDEFKQVAPGYSECVDIAYYKTWIIRTKKILELKTAIDSSDHKNIISCILYFLFVGHPDSNNDISPMYETNRFQFNFWNYIEYGEGKELNYNNLQDKIDAFINELETDFFNSQMEFVEYGEERLDYFQSYPCMNHCTWQQIITLLKCLKKCCNLLQITENGNVQYQNDYSPESSFVPPDNIITLANSVLTDIVSEELVFVHPHLKFENKNFIGDWNISSLLEAMYFELFITLSQDAKLKKCPCCGQYFEVSKTNTRKIYCSPHCSTLMAKRKQREREKLKNS